MSKTLNAVAMSAAILLTGCKSTPTTDTVYGCANAIGIAAGLVANQTGIDDQSRNAVIEIIGIVAECIPATNETFAAAWTPIAQAHTDQLIAEGKINEEQAKVIMAAFNAAVIGVDYIFVRYPTARQYKELTCAAVDGFTGGFLATFKPVNDDSRDALTVFDADAYIHITDTMAKGK